MESILEKDSACADSSGGLTFHAWKTTMDSALQMLGQRQLRVAQKGP